jgi:hypothetical protein
MGVIESVSNAMHNPIPVASVDDILRPGGDNPLVERGFVTTNLDTLINWARTGSSEVGHFHGQLRQRRRLLPLFLFRGSRLRPHRAGRHLRAGLSADRGSPGLRYPAADEENPPHQQLRPIRIGP